VRPNPCARFTSLVLPLIAFAAALGTAFTGFNSAHAADDTALRLFNVNAANTGYVRVANNAAFSIQTFTLEAWVQRVGSGYGLTTDALGACIIAKPIEGASGSYLGSWHLNLTTSGALIFTVVHTAATSGVSLTASAIPPLGLHHFAATFDGDSLRAFVDGVQAAQTSWNLGSVYYGNEDVLIGAQNFGSGYLRRFDGFIDDVRIWNYARSATEIAAAMNCRLSGSEPGLVSYWTFDGFNLVDVTGHGHNGVAVGTPGSVTYAALATISSCAVGVETPLAAAHDIAALNVFPQPSRGAVTVSFELPREGLATLDLFDVTGRRQQALTSQVYSAGRHELPGFVAPIRGTIGTGLYFLRLQYEGQTVVRRLVLVD